MPNNIKSERYRIGMTQEQLAEELSVSDSTIRGWEQGIRSIPSTYAVEMSDLFGCSVDYLFGLIDERTKTVARIAN